MPYDSVVTFTHDDQELHLGRLCVHAKVTITDPSVNRYDVTDRHHAHEHGVKADSITIERTKPPTSYVAVHNMLTNEPEGARAAASR